MKRSTKIAIGAVLFTLIASTMLLFLDDGELRHSTDLRDHHTLPVGGGENYRQLNELLTKNDSGHTRYTIIWEKALWAGGIQHQTFFEQHVDEILDSYSWHQPTIEQLLKLANSGMIASEAYDHPDQSHFFLVGRHEVSSTDKRARGLVALAAIAQRAR